MGYQALLFCPDEKLAAVVSQVFSELDFTVETVHEPFGAVKKLMAQRYDALVVDSENEQNASLLFKSARNSSFNQGSLAIALAEGQMGVAKAYRIGANHVLTKPINVEQTKGTLRVARGLLRKSSDAAEISAGTAHAATAAATPAKTTPMSAERSFQPANPGTPAMATRSTRPQAVEFQAPLAPMPMIAETETVELLEEFPASTASAKLEDKPAAVPAVPAKSPITIASTTAPDRRKAFAPVTGNAIPVPSQATSSASASVPGSAAAAAPAKEVSAPPAKQNKIAEAEPASTFHDTPLQDAAHETASASTLSSSTLSAASVGHTPSFAALDEDSGGSGGKKKILIVAAIVLAVAALGYFGYGYLVHPATSQPVRAPQDSGQPKTLRPTSAPVETLPQTTPDSASITTPASAPTLAPKATTGVTTGNPSAGAAKPPALRIAAGTSESNAPNISLNMSADGAANSEPGVKKPASAPILVKPNTGEAKTQARDEESAPPLSAPVVVASANDSNLRGLISSTPSNLAKPALSTLRVSQGVSQGLLIKRVNPTYPPAALRLHTQGAVLIEVTINKEGNVTNPKVLSGDRLLSQAALEAVRQWRYKPYLLDGTPVDIQTQITVNFKAN